MTVQAPASSPETSARGSEKPWAIQHLPPFPAVALQLLTLLDDDDVPMKRVVDLLRVDPALSAEILRVSNSALYGLSRRIDNVSHAVVVLGTEVVKRLALTVALGRFSRRSLSHQGLRICWDHSMAVALLSERLAEAMHLPRDRGYTAGLLHDVGRLALLACYPVEYGNMLDVARENDFDQLECERQLFDIDHSAAGEWLARHWNLPDDLVDSIARHHDPAQRNGDIPSAVRGADRLANAMGFAVVRRDHTEDPLAILNDLPLHDVDRFVEQLQGFEETIHTTINAISPH